MTYCRPSITVSDSFCVCSGVRQRQACRRIYLLVTSYIRNLSAVADCGVGCTGWLKKFGTFFSVRLISNINRFSKLFHCQNPENL